MSTLKDTLVKAGLPEHQAEVYVILASGGEMLVPQILEKTELSRATVYDALPELLVRGLIEYRKEGREAYYKPVHPNKLFDLLEQKKRDTALLEDEMKTTVQTLIGTYSLVQHQPGIRFFEGKDGVTAAYDELLSLGLPIDSIEDKGDMMEFIPEYATSFVKRRSAKKIMNRVVAPSTNEINITSQEEYRETRTIPVDEFPFTMDIKIAGDSVFLVPLKEKNAVAVRIDHPQIAENFRLIFKFFWHHAARRLEADLDKTNPKSLDTSSTV